MTKICFSYHLKFNTLWFWIVGWAKQIIWRCNFELQEATQQYKTAVICSPIIFSDLKSGPVASWGLAVSALSVHSPKKKSLARCHLIVLRITSYFPLLYLSMSDRHLWPHCRVSCPFRDANHIIIYRQRLALRCNGWRVDPDQWERKKKNVYSGFYIENNSVWHGCNNCDPVRLWHFKLQLKDLSSVCIWNITKGPCLPFKAVDFYEKQQAWKVAVLIITSRRFLLVI